MQEDQLLSGSIADNICFFETTFEQQRMITCAQIAGVHDEIMGHADDLQQPDRRLGQLVIERAEAARLADARALSAAKILFLDEGTAHLDVEKERQINESLRRMSMTRVSVAHRPEITSGADSVLRIDSAAACAREEATQS